MNSAPPIALGISLIGVTPASAADFGGGETGMIADGPDTVTAFELDVAAQGTTFNFAALHLDIQHTWTGDLTIVLEHDGVSVTLLDRLGVPESEFGQGMNLNGVYSFADSGGDSWSPYDNNVSSGLEIPGGVYELNNTDGSRLSDFHGQNIHGTWTLFITDSFQADTGFVRGWSMVHFASPPSPSAASLFGIGAIAAGRRRR